MSGAASYLTLHRKLTAPPCPRRTSLRRLLPIIKKLTLGDNIRCTYCSGRLTFEGYQLGDQVPAMHVPFEFCWGGLRVSVGDVVTGCGWQVAFGDQTVGWSRRIRQFTSPGAGRRGALRYPVVASNASIDAQTPCCRGGQYEGDNLVLVRSLTFRRGTQHRTDPALPPSLAVLLGLQPKPSRWTDADEALLDAIVVNKVDEVRRSLRGVEWLLKTTEDIKNEVRPQCVSGGGTTTPSDRSSRSCSRRSIAWTWPSTTSPATSDFFSMASTPQEERLGAAKSLTTSSSSRPL